MTAPKRGERGWVPTTAEDIADCWADARRIVHQEREARRRQLLRPSGKGFWRELWEWLRG